MDHVFPLLQTSAPKLRVEINPRLTYCAIFKANLNINSYSCCSHVCAGLRNMLRTSLYLEIRIHVYLMHKERERRVFIGWEEFIQRIFPLFILFYFFFRHLSLSIPYFLFFLFPRTRQFFPLLFSSSYIRRYGLTKTCLTAPIYSFSVENFALSSFPLLTFLYFSISCTSR